MINRILGLRGFFVCTLTQGFMCVKWKVEIPAFAGMTLRWWDEGIWIVGAFFMLFFFPVPNIKMSGLTPLGLYDGFVAVDWKFCCYFNLLLFSLMKKGR
jgi:hypothetical protein